MALVLNLPLALALSFVIRLIRCTVFAQVLVAVHHAAQVHWVFCALISLAFIFGASQRLSAHRAHGAHLARAGCPWSRRRGRRA